MSEMIERVAAAIIVEAYKTDGMVIRLGVAKAVARAAIEAMREPTNEMCDAADWQQQSEVNQYQRAIDAALG